MRQAFKDIADQIGSAHILTREADKAPYLREGRGLWQGKAAAIARPATTAEAAAIIQIAARHGLHIIPQGGGTGLVGGQIGFDADRALIVNMARMNNIREIDAANNILIAEAGCVLADIHQAAERIARQFPLRLASEGSAQIGGLLATNAGGHHVIRYGMMRDLTLGLEAVLADGRIWHGLSRMRKDNSGYDLKNLLIGSEGTLALLTAAALRLAPEERDIATAMAALPSIQAAVALFQHARQMAGDHLIAFELIPRLGMDFILRHFEAARDPFPDRSAWYVLIDASSIAALEKILADTHAVIARSEAQAAQLWFLRENLSDVQKKEGASIKHDISVPLDRWADFTQAAHKKLNALIPDIRPLIFGHLGDGNLHFNLSRPEKMDDAAFLSKRAAMHDIVYDLVLSYDGAISAEHGIGVAKREALVKQKGATAIDMMRKIKAALDPDNRFNPDKIFLQ